MVATGEPYRENWTEWATFLRYNWVVRLQETVLMYAAMVSCQTSLSAVGVGFGKLSACTGDIQKTRPF
jgi:hypothetical protein